MLLSEGGPASAAAMYEEARKTLAGVADHDPRARKRLPLVLGKLGQAYNLSGDLSGSLRSYEAMQVAARAALADDPKSADAKRHLANAQVCAGDARARLSGPDAGLPDMRRGLETLREMAKSTPNSSKALRTVATASGWIGDVLVLAKRYPEATTYFRSALDVADKLSSLDAQNAQYTRDRINYLNRLADAHAGAGNKEEARRLTRQLLALLKPMASEPDASEFELYQYAWTLVNTPFSEFQNWSEAERTAKRLVTSTQSKDAMSLDVLARAYGGQGKYDDAQQTEERALALLPRQRSPLRTELEANLQRFTAQRAGVGTKVQP
jgi:tetratricopeptide (TPR) repeat protein